MRKIASDPPPFAPNLPSIGMLVFRHELVTIGLIHNL